LQLSSPLTLWSNCELFYIQPFRYNINILSIPLSGSDSTSSFTGKGKATCLKVARSKVEYVRAFQDLGKQMTVDQGTMSYLQKFVCHLHGQENEIDVDNARHNLFRMGNCTEETLPPTSDSLVQHIHRANYESYVRRRCMVQTITAGSPDGHDWYIENGQLCIKWMTLPVAPDSVLEIVNCSCKTGCKSNRCSCKKANLNCTDLCKCSDSCKNKDRSERDDFFIDFDDEDAYENDEGLDIDNVN
jgi:hypothetical protein